MRCRRRVIFISVMAGLAFDAAWLMRSDAPVSTMRSIQAPHEEVAVDSGARRAAPTIVLARLSLRDALAMPPSVSGGMSGFAVPVPPAHEVQHGEPASAPTPPVRPWTPVRRRRLVEIG